MHPHHRRTSLHAPEERTASCRSRARAAATVLVIASCALLPCRAGAGPLTLALVPAFATGHPGDVLTFSGTITNTTGVSLNATDVFLNFSGYDPAALTDMTQLLGAQDFLLPNNAVSSVVPILSVMLAPTAGPGTYTLAVAALDINNNISNTALASAQVQTAASSVPEPSTIFLVCSGMALVVGRRATYRRHGRRDPLRPSQR